MVGPYDVTLIFSGVYFMSSYFPLGAVNSHNQDAVSIMYPAPDSLGL